MNFKNTFYNIDFNKNILLSESDDEIIIEIEQTLKNLTALNILNDKKLLKETIKEANSFAKNKKNFLVFGTGGSNLGAKTLINSLQKNNEVNIDFFDNIDPIQFQNRIENIDLLNSGFIIISKSGSTPETLSQYATLIEIFEQKNCKEILYRNSLFITENKPSPLANIARQNNSQILDHHREIGGRYSIFSNVGMLPSIIAGIDVEAIYKGANEQINNKDAKDYLKIAKFYRFQNIIHNLNSTVLMTYSDSLFFFGKWYLQLWAESIGKNQKGITPIHSVGTTDQHSQLQLYLDGPKDKFYTFITSNHSERGLKLNSKAMKDNNVEYLIDKKMGDLMQAEQRATIDTFIKNKFSCREISLNKINEHSMGQLLASCIQETIATCLYFKVNPFDQPAVEQGKILTKKYLI